ncbi:ATP-binding protein [Sphingobacterium lactis]|uniref:ATP-binding protein n=1 Tax=Sphingobacterium lactis TaxID=797291 RepID=UPI003EC8BAA7
MASLTEINIREIYLRVYRTNARIFIELMDSGALIDPGIISKIFLPFYTTRKEGAGIGLSLSKSIIEAPQGYLYYQEKADKNCFVIVLMDKMTL